MSRKIPQGICRLCEIWGDLTFEHSPPRSAGNSGSYNTFDFDKLYAAQMAGELDLKGTKKKQGGVGFPNLCANCNNQVLNKYVKPFTSFSRAFQLELDKYDRDTLNKAPHLDVVLPDSSFRAGAFAKSAVAQILCGNDSLGLQEETIRGWLLDYDSTEFPDSAQLFLCLYADTRLAISGSTVHAVNFKGLGTDSVSVASSTAGYASDFYPLTFALFPDGGEPSNDLYADVSEWARHHPGDTCTGELSLGVIPPDIAFNVRPLWARTNEEIRNIQEKKVTR